MDLITMRLFLQKILIIWIFSLLITSKFVIAKNIFTPTQIDSLERLIITSDKDSISMDNLLLLADYYLDKNLSKSRLNAKKSYQIASDIKSVYGTAQALFHIAKVERISGKLGSAIDHVLQAEKYFKLLNNEKALAEVMAEMGNIYSAMGNMVKAIENYQKAITIFEKINDELGVAQCYSDLGNTHYLQKNYYNALKYFKRAIKMFESQNALRSVAELYNRVSNVYRDMNELEKSMDYNYYALMIQEKLRDKSGIALSNMNIGITSIAQNKLSTAKGYLDYAIKLYTEIGDQIGISRCLLLNAEIEWIQENLVISRELLEKSIGISRNAGALQELAKGYYMISMVYDKKENFKQAYEYLNEYTLLKDSLYSEEKTRVFSEMEVKYRTRSKEKELMVQKVKNHEKNTQFVISIGVFTAVALLFLIVLFLMNNRNKERKEANQQLEERNALIHSKNQEIIDSIQYAKRIQDAVITPKSYLEHMFPKHFIYYQPKDIVSGDFYWAYQDPVSNKYFWVIADCTGHGVPGALLSVIGSIILNEVVIVGKNHQPNVILKKLSRYIKKYINANDELNRDGIELSLFIWDKDQNKLSFCGANGKAFIMKKSGEIIDLKGSKQPIGFDPFNREINEFEVINIPLEKGDWIVAFTDGYPDQLEEKSRKKYKIGRLKNNIQLWCAQNPETIEAELKSSLKKWMGESAQIDDVLVFGIKV